MPIITNENHHMAFFSVKDMNTLIERLAGKNTKRESWYGEMTTKSERPDGINQICFQDPNGYWIEANDVGFQ
ncbi:MAG: hypothetical protein AAFQ02_03670 [Bacteroidota bacterium]